MRMKIYHTFFKEYQGADEKAVVQSLYEDSRAGTGLSYKDWWDYQKKLWSQRYGMTVPDMNAPEAEKELLALLLKVGALENGKKPPRQNAASQSPKNG
jgi:hypothetical protein